MVDFENNDTTGKWGNCRRMLASFLVGASVHTRTDASRSDMHNIHVLFF